MKGKVIILISMLFLFSCGGKQVRVPEAERIFKDAEIRSSAGVNLPAEDIVNLEKRVKTYWDARMEGNAVKMFELEDPDVIEKSKLTLTGYIQSKTPAIVDKSYEVKGIEIVDQEKVRVFIILNAYINLPQAMRDETAVIRDIWLKKQGNWYRWLVLNPFSVIPQEKMQGMEAKPYDGPLGSDIEKAGETPESGVKIEIAPKKLGGVEGAPVQKDTPGKDSKEKK